MPTINYKGYSIMIDECDLPLLYQYNCYIAKNGQKKYLKCNIIMNGKKTTGIFHRILLSAKKDQQIDHKDGNGLNNQRNNLRFASGSQNCANKKKVFRKTTTSIFKGVHWCNIRKTWIAKIEKNGKKIYLGASEIQEVAASLYNKKAIELFGEFALLNNL
jgi:hypothetical protein